MTPSLAVAAATYAWMLGGAALVVVIAWDAFRHPPSQGEDYLSVFVAMLAGIGSMVLAARSAGFPTAALWAWRASSIAVLLVSIFATKNASTAGTVRSTSDVPPRRSWAAPAAAGLGVIVALLLSVASLVAGDAFMRRAPASKVLFTIDGVRLWQGIALAILAIGTIVFLWLFVRMIDRGITPQFESHWGGLGGGMSGWRISPSLTYLLAALVFGTLFAIFVVQLETPAEQSTGTQPGATSTQPAATTTAAKK